MLVPEQILLSLQLALPNNCEIKSTLHACRAALPLRPKVAQLVQLTVEVAQKVARNNRLLNLAGSLIDAKQPHILIESRDGILFHVASPSMELHGFIGDSPYHLSGKELAARSERVDRFTGIATFGGIQHHTFSRIALRLTVRNHPL